MIKGVRFQNDPNLKLI